jgi:broad specificity phosphatase PhoE
MSETTLYFVRHGESVANAAKRYAGQTDSPLTARGREQARVVAGSLRGVPFDRVVASDLSRARDTAELIAAEHGLRVEVLPELREIDLGEAAGRSIEDAKQRFDWGPGRFVEWPGGESLDQVVARAVPAIERVVRSSPGKTVCIVGHGGVTRILISHWLGLLPALYQHHSPTENTNVTVVRTDGRAYRVESLFDAAHLADRPPSPEERVPAPGIPDAGERAI